MRVDATPTRSVAIGLPDVGAEIADPNGQVASQGTWLKHYWGALIHGLRAASALAFLAVIALHPAFVSRYMTTDGHLEEGSRRLLSVLEGTAVLSGVGLLLLAKAGRQYTNFKARIALGMAFSLASVLACTLLAEAGLRIVHAVGRPMQAQRHYFFSHDSMLGWQHRPRSLATFKNVRVSINSVGLRDDELRGAGAHRTFRILFLGDSQVFGDGVAHEDTFVEILQAELSQIEAINAGVIGYGTDQQLLYYERGGAKLNPDLTIVGINAYDLRDNISTRVRSGYQKPVFDVRASDLTLTGVPVDPGSIIDRVQRGLNGSSHLYATVARLARGSGERTRDGDGPDSTDAARPSARTVFPPAEDMSRALEVTRLILARFAVDSAQTGKRLAVMFLPYEMDLVEDQEYREQSDRLVKALREWGGRENYPVLDLRDILRAAPSRDLFLDTMHFSAAGHRIVARATREWLIASGLVPRSQTK